MITSFCHRGLKRLFERGERRQVSAEYVGKIERILARLNVAKTVSDVDAPGYGLHQLKGHLKGVWAVTVSGNWRITFRFQNGDAYDVDFADYH